MYDAIMSEATLHGDAFRQAVVAIDAGDVETLRRLLEANPQLASQRLDGLYDWLCQQVAQTPTHTQPREVALANYIALARQKEDV